MSQLINFQHGDLLGSITYVDTEQVIVQIENKEIMTRISVGSIVAIETGKKTYIYYCIN